MAYTSKAQMIDRWGSTAVLLSADRDPQDGATDDAAIDAACADASSLIDSYLAKGGYATPVAPVPDVLTMHATNIAVYQLSPEVGGSYTKEKRQRYEDALAWLEAIAAGKIDMPQDGGGPVVKPATSGARATGYPLAYQAAHLRGLV